MKPNCEHCEYWLKNNPNHINGDKFGDCRRYPPGPGHKGRGAWPQVQTDQYCGEWKADGAL